jgi:FkbM family methyltransferase
LNAASFDRARFQLALRWQYSVRRRLAGLTWLTHRLPWWMWCRLCAWEAPGVIRELAQRSGRPLRFVQIGSNEGVANDPLHETVRSHAWTGLLVEPLPHLFRQLTANYDGVPAISFANAAIAGEDGRITMYKVDARPGDPEWVDQIASLDREVILRHAYALPELEERIVSVEVQCRTLPSLVAQHELRTIDVLHIDAEGFDDQIISQIPIGAPWTPRYLLFEKKHMDADAYERTKRHLEAGGYRLVNLWPDEFAYRATPARRQRA